VAPPPRSPGTAGASTAGGGPLPVALSNGETGTYGSVNDGLLLAGAVIAMIPCVVVYVSLQRYHVRGPVSGALKG
jgi:multiple sugar transport system permease protein